jgi:hypothetical protein
MYHLLTRKPAHWEGAIWLGWRSSERAADACAT